MNSAEPLLPAAGVAELCEIVSGDCSRAPVAMLVYMLRRVDNIRDLELPRPAATRAISYAAAIYEQ